MKEDSAHLNYFQKAVFFLIFAALFCVVVYRAMHLTFTHDESLSYQIINGDEGLKGTANYHYLNTWLMNICQHVFGDSELSLRLPNVLAFLLYAFYAYRLLLPNSFFLLTLSGAFLLLLNPYLLDFFSLARGYGLSLGFMLASLYHCLQLDKNEASLTTFIKKAFICMALAALGLLANFNLLNFYLSVFVVLGVKTILYVRANTAFTKKQVAAAVLCALACCLPLLVAMQRLLVLKETNQLYYGSDSFDYTLYALTVCSFDFSQYVDGSQETIAQATKYLFAGISVYALLAFRKCDKRLLQLLLILSMIVVGLFIENRFFSALFPLNRTSIYLAPLYALLCYYFLLSLRNQLKSKPGGAAIAVPAIAISVALVYNIFHRLNLNQVGDWYLEAHTKQTIQLLLNTNEVKNNKGKKVRLAVNWIFLPSVNYYINSRQLPIVAARIDAPESSEANFIYEFTDNLKPYSLSAVKIFEDIPVGLYNNLGKSGAAN